MDIFLLPSSLWPSSLGNIHDYLISPVLRKQRHVTPQTPTGDPELRASFFFTLFLLPSFDIPFALFPCVTSI